MSAADQAATQQVTVTVTQASPLLVLADGADTPCPASTTGGATYAAGDRVQATVRTPRRPLITGMETTT